MYLEFDFKNVQAFNTSLGLFPKKKKRIENQIKQKRIKT